MTFSPSGLELIGSGPRTRTFAYETADSLSTVLASGYFDAIRNQLRVNDRIQVEHANGVADLIVAAISAAGALTIDQVARQYAAGAAIQPRQMLMAARCSYVNGAAIDGTANTTWMSRTPHWASPQSDWSDIVLRFGNFGVAGDDGPANVTLRVGIETSTGLFLPVWWPNGSRDITLSPGAVIDSVPVPVTIAAGTKFYVRVFGTAASAGQWGKCAYVFASDGGVELGGTDKTLSGTVAASSGSTIPLPPLAILGTPSDPASGSAAYTAKPAIAIALLTDSIGVGTGETGTNLHSGFLCRALTSSYAYTHLGQSGYSVNNISPINNTNSWGRLYRRANCLQGLTHALCNLGTNDIAPAQNFDVPTLITHYQAVNSELLRRGIKLIPMTILPRTDAANSGGFQGTDTQTQRDRRNALNDWVRGNPFGWGYFDATLYAQDPANKDAWRTDLGTPTTDGLHPATVIHTAVGAALQAALPSLLV